MQKDQIKLLFLLFRQKAQLLFNKNRNVLRGIFYALNIKLGTLQDIDLLQNHILSGSDHRDITEYC